MKHLLKKITGKSAKRSSLPGQTRPIEIEGEFALVLVDTPSANQKYWTIGAVTDLAGRMRGEVLQILGGLVLVGFGVIHRDDAGADRRAAFVDALKSDHSLLVRALHGRWRALLGTFGGAHRKAYTAIPDEFADRLGQLSRLNPGETEETAG